MKTLPINQIKKLLESNQISTNQMNELRQDERKGVQRLVQSYERKIAQLHLQKIQFKRIKQFDEQYKVNERTVIAGIDEAGRGPLAGPVVSAAVILPTSFECIGINDSKQLNEQKRNEFFDVIVNYAIDYSISIIDNSKIDEMNILEATRQSMIEALLQLSPTPDVTLIDAVSIQLPKMKTISINKGDAQSLSIAAASILAKVTRDRLMNEIDKQYPQYDFKHNKGYGSKKHIEAIKKYGPTPFHRKTFAPVRNVLNL